jgi:hypothetical protein
MVTEENPAIPTVGVNPVITGPPAEGLIVKGSLLESEPAGVVTMTGPVVAPAGTLVVI